MAQVRKPDLAQADQTPEPESRPALSRRRRRLFIVVSLALPALLLVGAEGTVRLCGFGGYPPAIQKIGPVPGGTLVVTSVPGAASYFSRSQSRGGAITEQSFLTPKPPGTLRIFLTGESAIKGFPQPPALANSAFLQAPWRCSGC